LKPITEPCSNDVSVAGDRPVGVRLALRLLRGYKFFISPYFYGSCRFLPGPRSERDQGREAPHDVEEVPGEGFIVFAKPEGSTS